MLGFYDDSPRYPDLVRSRANNYLWGWSHSAVFQNRHSLKELPPLEVSKHVTINSVCGVVWELDEGANINIGLVIEIVIYLYLNFAIGVIIKMSLA